MVWLSFNFITLAAVVENVLYIHPPSDVRNINAQLKTDSYSYDLWIPLYYRLIDNDRTRTFQTVLPESRNRFYQYKLQVEFLNNSILESREWTTIGIGPQQQTISKILCRNETLNSTSTDSRPHASIYLIYTCLITIAVVFGILLSRMFYLIIGKSKCDYFKV
ncbi:unnamed protein product [Ceutorhynchus assimilis]|uniref:Uncharacterized protein n=1 Tax=Ceutorhynchus assimilis TaxID=467358 RepID=A0A9N9MDC3_9CUCU|nr:unnamed protein product [Ceutorhynchus assimilis]